MLVEAYAIFQNEFVTSSALMVAFGMAGMTGSTSSAGASSIDPELLIEKYDEVIGNYTTPTEAGSSSNAPDLGETPADNAQTGSNSNNWNGSISLYKFSGLTVGAKISKVEVYFQGTGGNCRVGVYDEVAAIPKNLLAESVSTARSGIGKQKIALTSSATVPANGIIWVAFEVDTGANIEYKTGGSYEFIAHAYGSLPAVLGATTNGTSNPYMGYVVLGDAKPDDMFDTDTTKRWESTSENEPSGYVGVGSSLLITQIALWLHANTTGLEIAIEHSTDAVAWTLLRTELVSNLTTGLYEFHRGNIKLGRYVRARITDAGNTVLAIAEFKIKTITDINLGRGHGHVLISPTNNALGRDGT